MKTSALRRFSAALSERRPRILVVGDALIDRSYLLSAPLSRRPSLSTAPKFTQESFALTLGGAPAQAAMLSGHATVTLLTVLPSRGELAPEFRRLLTSSQQLQKCRILGLDAINSSANATTRLYTRDIDGLVREVVGFRDGGESPLLAHEAEKILALVPPNEQFDVVIIADFDRGVVTADLLRGLARRVPAPERVVIDAGTDWHRYSAFDDLVIVSRRDQLISDTERSALPEESAAIANALERHLNIRALIVKDVGSSSATLAARIAGNPARGTLQTVQGVSVVATPLGGGAVFSAFLGLALASGREIEDAALVGQSAACAYSRKAIGDFPSLEEVLQQAKSQAMRLSDGSQITLSLGRAKMTDPRDSSSTPARESDSHGAGAMSAPIFHTTIMGNVNNLAQGHSAVVHSHSTTPLDFDALMNSVQELSLSPADIASLRASLLEEPKSSGGKLGPRVAAWLADMSKKAVSGAGGVAAKTATTVLPRLLARYYGLPIDPPA